jgi:hypothetical protein
MVKESSGMGVILEQAAESFSTLNGRIRGTGRSFRGREETEIILALVVPFKMIMIDIFGQRPPQ